MSDEQNPGVDPRFDPAFQRGFDPATPIEEYVPPLAPRPAVVRPSVLAAPAEAASPTSPASSPPAASSLTVASPAGASPTGASPNVASSAPAEATQSRAGYPGAVRSGDPQLDGSQTAIAQPDDAIAVGTLGFDEPSVVVSDEASAARNPFLIALAVIAVIFVVGGVWLFVRSGDAFDSKEVRSQGDFMSLTAAVDAAPFIALLGAATAIGVLFFFASRYRRRR